MKPKDLRKKWMDENNIVYEDLLSYEKLFHTQNLCFGHGEYRSIEFSNAEYTRWLEKVITGKLHTVRKNMKLHINVQIRSDKQEHTDIVISHIINTDKLPVKDYFHKNKARDYSYSIDVEQINDSCPAPYGYGICANCEKPSRHAYENKYSLCERCMNVEFEEIKSNPEERKKNAEN